jgi:tryptophan synthase beta chain
MLLQDRVGQVLSTESISAGLDYPGVGPEHAYYQLLKRATYVAASDAMALRGSQLLAKTEGILPALEPAHAIGYLERFAPKLKKGSVILLGLSGRGDKDVGTLAEKLFSNGSTRKHV